MPCRNIDENGSMELFLIRDRGMKIRFDRAEKEGIFRKM